ncbi:DUF1289 domain-containing protein [Flocculibacter collagenilyticus]|uniref:DUF1289 domain-containing protein n=1 Tax=Flocculibacter collagenilyticus TaxID=2744479 RepID=UPI0018F5636C|nr:DUF1289 domain-containing protein [Flocculibacter collagenilyticus]
MEQIEIFNIPSPCRNVCQTDNKGYCLGCMRNRDERFYWNQLSDADKLKVLKLCKLRKKRRLAKQISHENSSDEEQLQGSLFE